jgi:methylated-DNA-[protein]-cysteine S-methyltransferase
MIYAREYLCPVGPITIRVDDEAVIDLSFSYLDEVSTHPSALLDEAIGQLDEYFNGLRKEFTLPLKTHGTPFQEAVWSALRAIPYGETATYGQIAAQVGRPKGPRAVGMANNRNPIGIIIPCHRVIGKDGKLVGFGGGLGMKQFLLELEQAHR